MPDNLPEAPSTDTKVLILGGGAAGLTAAIYAARANLEPMVIAGVELGGQLTLTTDVENFPGFADGVQGPWLMEQMQRQAERFGARIVADQVTSIDLSRRPFRALGEEGRSYTGDTVIICTGARARWLGLSEEGALRGRGLSACATCDGFFFREQEVAVVGGGNTAIEEALFLTRFARKVWLIHRRDALRAEQILQKRVFSNPKIEVIWNTVVERLLTAGDSQELKGVALRDTRSGTRRELALDGLFVAIGHEPATQIFRGQLPMDDDGYLVTAPASTATVVPGVYAAGDVIDKVYRQAVTAAGLGCMAALEAERFLAHVT